MLASPSASTVALPVQYYWQYILDQGPALLVDYTVLGGNVRIAFVVRIVMCNTSTVFTIP